MSALQNFSQHLQIVIVASQNPVKIAAVSGAFTQVFPDLPFEFVGISAKSEVSDQPMTDEETLFGAENRIKNAKLAYPNAHFWVALEGGLQEVDGKLEAFAYILIQSQHQTGKSKTATFILPQKIAELIHTGMELGDADDVVFGGTNSKQKNGSVGILTNDIITRKTFYEQSVILALIPFMNENLY